MRPVEPPTSPIAGLRTVELWSGDEPALQRFFQANPLYFLAVNGEPAGPGEAHEEIHGELPAGWAFTKKWVVGYLDTDNQVVALANVVSDLLAPGVWHIGTFIVASSRHGSGDAQVLYRGVEDWVRAKGAYWLRLGVVQGNVRAERFWEALGYVETRTRTGIEMGGAFLADGRQPLQHRTRLREHFGTARFGHGQFTVMGAVGAGLLGFLVHLHRDGAAGGLQAVGFLQRLAGRLLPMEDQLPLPVPFGLVAWLD